MGERAPLRSIEPARVAGGLGMQLLDGARFAVDDDSDIVAYAIVATHKNGRTSSAATVGDDCPFNRYAFVGMVKEVIREVLITNDAARSIVNRANGFED
jgi:hypothetical protein